MQLLADLEVAVHEALVVAFRAEGLRGFRLLAALGLLGVPLRGALALLTAVLTTVLTAVLAAVLTALLFGSSLFRARDLFGRVQEPAFRGILIEVPTVGAVTAALSLIHTSLTTWQWDLIYHKGKK